MESPALNMTSFAYEWLYAMFIILGVKLYLYNTHIGYKVYMNFI